MIFGEQMRLRAPERSDLPLFCQWLNDPEVTAGLIAYLPYSLIDEEAWFDAMLKRPLEEHILVIEVHEEERWIAIGRCGFHGVDHRLRLAEIGICIGEKAYWNRGCGAQAMRIMLRHGFCALNLNRIFLQVNADNARAIRCYEQVGFVREGVQRQAAYKNGRYIDVIIMSVLRSEWENAGQKAEE